MLGKNKTSKTTAWKRTLIGRAAGVAAAVMLALMATPAGAATINVNTTNDTSTSTTCALRDAITVSEGTTVSGTGCPSPTTDTSNMITFSVTGTITLGSTLPAITGTLKIIGPDPTSSAGVTISGGGAVRPMQVNSGTALTLQYVTLANGSFSDGNGAGILNVGTLTIENCTLSGNQGSDLSGTADGGAILNTSTLTIINSTFSSNVVTGGVGGPGRGGAISNSGTVAITNSTFSGNQAMSGAGGGAGQGGAIFNDGGTLTITNVTFSGNKAINGDGSSGKGGAIDNNGGTVNVKGTIMAASTGGNCFGTAVTASFNIADDSSCFTNGTNGNGVVANTSAIGLGALADNGGSTQTIALQAGSPAIDVIPTAPTNDCTDLATGIVLTTDQRGFPRPDAGEVVCDIGAYEFQDPTFAGVPGTANCKGKSVSALTQQYGTLEAAAAALRYPDVKSLQDAIRSFCGG